MPFSLWADDHKLNDDQTTAGWTFRTNKRQQLQLLLSDDFTVLRGSEQSRGKGDNHECNGDGTRAGWTYRTNTRQRLQLVLSDDFTVLRGVNKVEG